MINLTAPSILIIIDLWDSITDQIRINNIIDFINKNDFIEKVYGGIYTTAPGPRKEHRDIARIEKPFENLSKKWERVIAKFGSKYQGYDAFELRLRLLSEMPHIENIYITGFAFDQCIRTRSLGYRNLRQVLSDKNIIINKTLVGDFTEEIIEESPAEWAYIDEETILYSI